jgi:hypothetical protein
MKRMMILFFLLACSASVSAQEHETLFSAPVKHGGFGGVAQKLTVIRGEPGFMMGGYGGWLIDQRLMIGGGGYGLVSNVRASNAAEAAYSPVNEPLYVEFSYGGLMLEYIFSPHKLVHVNVQALIGGGSATHRSSYFDEGFGSHRGDVHHYGRREALFVAEPTLNVELNVTQWFRIAAGGSYRFVTGANDIVGLTNGDLSGPSANLAFKFGAF